MLSGQVKSYGSMDMDYVGIQETEEVQRKGGMIGGSRPTTPGRSFWSSPSKRYLAGVGAVAIALAGYTAVGPRTTYTTSTSTTTTTVRELMRAHILTYPPLTQQSPITQPPTLPPSDHNFHRARARTLNHDLRGTGHTFEHQR